MALSPDQFFKCLAEETRLRCLLLLLDCESLCVCELHESLGLSQPKVSRHLADLRRCAIVADERRGRWIYYRLHPELPLWALQVLRLTKAANPQFVADSEARLNPTRQCEVTA